MRIQRRILFLVLASFVIPFSAHAITLHVSPTGSGQDGLSWENAFTAIASALTASASGDDIWVAKGVYNETIQLVTGVSVFGGFSGFESERPSMSIDPQGPETTIDATGFEASAVHGADQSKLEGFTITGGRGSHGGGIYGNRVSLSLNNLWIVGNEAKAEQDCDAVGGDWNWTFSDCSGGCPLVGGEGGGIYLKESTAEIRNCYIAHNRAPMGAGIYCDTSRNLEVYDCAISLNDATATCV